VCISGGRVRSGPATPLAHPNARIADRLAPRGTTRISDFGEFLAAALYADRFGEIVPFQKLSTKPVAGATQQGADVLVLTSLPADMSLAGATEIKTPGVDEAHANIPEMPDVTGGDRRFPCKRYPSYLSIPYLDRLAGPLASSDNFTRRIRCGDVEGEDSLVEVLVEDPLEGSFEMPTSTRRRQEL